MKMNYLLGGGAVGLAILGAALFWQPQQALAPVAETAPIAGRAPDVSPLSSSKASTVARPPKDAVQGQEPDLYKIETAVAAARARGAGEDEVYRIRAASLPARTIAMLDEREQAEKIWKRRVQVWHDANAALAPGDEAGRKRLREQLFNEEERALLQSAPQSGTPQLVLH